MNPHWPQEPYNRFRETVQVGRNFLGYHDVTIYYTNKGRGEFSITGGTIRQIQSIGGDRRLTVDTNSGHTFDITRRKGNGGYHLNSGGFWTNYLGRTYF